MTRRIAGSHAPALNRGRNDVFGYTWAGFGRGLKEKIKKNKALIMLLYATRPCIQRHRPHRAAAWPVVHRGAFLPKKKPSHRSGKALAVGMGARARDINSSGRREPIPSSFGSPCRQRCPPRKARRQPLFSCPHGPWPRVFPLPGSGIDGPLHRNIAP